MRCIQLPFSQKKDGTEAAPAEVVRHVQPNCLNEEGILPLVEIEEIRAYNEIFPKAKALFQQDLKAIFLGGDHSITFPLAKAFSESYENAGIIIFDAHPDCSENFIPETGQDLVNSLIEKDIIKKENLILVGLRSWHKDEFNFLQKYKIRYFDMKRIMELGLKGAISTVMENSLRFNALYVSIDMDVLDPAYAPAVNAPVPGGLSARQLLYSLQKLKLQRNLKAVDITEINPARDKEEITSKLGAKIVMEMC